VSTGLAEIAWLCDTNVENLNRTAAGFPDANCTSNLSEVLADLSIQAMTISTPTATHFEIAN